MKIVNETGFLNMEYYKRDRKEIEKQSLPFSKFFQTSKNCDCKGYNTSKNEYCLNVLYFT